MVTVLMLNGGDRGSVSIKSCFSSTQNASLIPDIGMVTAEVRRNVEHGVAEWSWQQNMENSVNTDTKHLS